VECESQITVFGVAVAAVGMGKMRWEVNAVKNVGQREYTSGQLLLVWVSWSQGFKDSLYTTYSHLPPLRFLSVFSHLDLSRLLFI